MRQEKVHFSSRTADRFPACDIENIWQNVPQRRLTRNPAEVTCNRCKKTKYFRKKAGPFNFEF